MKRLIILFFAFILFLPVCLGFYIDTPDAVSVEKVLSGGYAEEFIELTGDYELVSQVDLSAAGNIADWVELTPKEHLLGRSETARFKMIITPPAGLGKGIYEGYIILSAVPVYEDQITSTVSVSKDIKIILEITDEEVKQAYVDTVYVSDVILGNPFEVEIPVENKGNVEANVLINVALLDLNKENILSLDSTVELPSMSQRTAYISIPNCPGIGSYFAKIQVSTENGLVMEQLSPFKVAEQISGEEYGPDESLAGGEFKASTVTLGANAVVIVTWSLIVVFIAWKVYSKKKGKAAKGRKNR
jgi:hypothetical protein